MGTYISTLFGDLTQDIPLALHPDTKGSQIILDTSRSIATRVATFHDGIVFSNRPIKVKEKVTLEILKEDGRWIGGLRLGFTSENPSLMDSKDLPPYACPNLVKQGKCWAAVIPNEYVGEGTIVSFWVTRKGNVFFSIEHQSGSYLLLEDVPVKKPLWAVLDIYGRTKAILLLDPSKPKTSKYESSQLLLNAAGQNESVCGHFSEHNSIGKECVICLCRKANVAMLPCWHSNFCFFCATKILYSSGCCPLCRQEVKKILCISAQAEEGIPAKWLEEVDGSQLPP
ncbi:E3 ubiquitin-protein ligase NEURL3 [Sphaerodactylus townsendi]|uniref:E3 ubiquitin-protein ligase NEURL3 n=1 Tax=Sphaerodactylus townsendi TaxID=933632 RepID=UPI0020271D87|nr:E3 ubiquitin-protein ligase NEURL3 [Sphaerodactylus townsendi]